MGKHSRKQNSKKTQGFQKIPLHIRNIINPLVKDLLNKCSAINIPKNQEWEHHKEIYNILQEICTIEKSYVVQLPKREANWNNFSSWCCEHSAVSHAVQIKEIQDGNYGMFAEKDVKENDLLQTIPRKLMMSTVAARESKLGPLISKDPILQNMPNVVLSLFLLLELIGDSFWQPYLSILPSTYNTILYFDLEEIQLLQGISVYDEVLSISRSVARQYAYFHQLFQSDSYARSLDISHYFTYDLYRWAVSTVMTRQNSVPSPDGDSKITTLIPLWDMFNHANGKFSSDFDVEKDCLVSSAMKDYKEGEEVFIFYGPRTNGEFFVHNGFVYSYNENDSIKVKLGLSKSDALYSLKSQLCEKQGLPINGAFQLFPHKMEDSLISFLKINVMKEDELKAELNEDAKSEINNPDLLRRVFVFLKTRISLLILAYKNVEKVDKAEVFQPHLHMISELCRAEKKVLQCALDNCSQNIVDC